MIKNKIASTEHPLRLGNPILIQINPIATELELAAVVAVAAAGLATAVGSINGSPPRNA
jgi:hypothetical protein